MWPRDGEFAKNSMANAEIQYFKSVYNYSRNNSSRPNVALYNEADTVEGWLGKNMNYQL